MNNLSALIITFNEEANIRPCLEALQKVAKEVLVIDSKSTDQTKAIAEQLGAKVIETEWKGYAATKNFGNELAEHDWILSIDADEVLSDELIKSINSLRLERGNVYALDRLTNYCGQWIKHSGWYPEWKIRLFHREDSSWEGAFVHERLKHQVPVQVEKVQGKLFHYSYKTKEEHLDRINKYARLSAQEMYAQGKQSNFIKIWISPAFRFLKTFLLKRGFLDGKNGWIISIRNAYLVQLKYKMLRDLNRNQ